MNATSVANTIGDVGSALIWILVVAIGVGIFVTIVWILSYRKKKVVLYEKMANGFRIREYRAKEYTNKDTIVKWRLWGSWQVTSKPPSKSTFQNEKGKMVAVGFLIDNHIVWSDEIKIDVSDGKLKSINFDPLVSEDRAVLVQELKSAEDYKKKKMGDLIAAAVPYIALIIILVSFMIFFGEVVQPSVTISNQNVVIMDKFDNLIERLDVMINNRPLLQGDSLTGNVTIPN